MSVPFIDLKRFEPGFLESWNSTVAELSAKAQFIGGAPVAGLEAALAAYCGTTHAISCANGTDAIQLALRALGIGAGDEVWVPDLTFWATYEAVVNVGATPVTVDCSPDDLQLDVDLVEDALRSRRPRAIIIAHLYGWASANLQRLRASCRAAGVALIEDGAQCFGTEVDGESIYRGALISTTSFYPAKVLGAAGDGGAVFCSDDELARTVRSLSNHGRSEHYSHGLVGWNSRMDSLQAAFLSLGLQHLEARLESRRAIAQRYRDTLAYPGMRVLRAPESFRENGYCNVILFDAPERRDRVQAALKAAGIGTGIIYPGAMSAQEGAKSTLGGRIGGGNAERACASVLSLPLFAYLSGAEFDEVRGAFDAAMQGA